MISAFLLGFNVPLPEEPEANWSQQLRSYIHKFFYFIVLTSLVSFAGIFSSTQNDVLSSCILFIVILVFFSSCFNQISYSIILFVTLAAIFVQMNIRSLDLGKWKWIIIQNENLNNDFAPFFFVFFLSASYKFLHVQFSNFIYHLMFNVFVVLMLSSVIIIQNNSIFKIINVISLFIMLFSMRFNQISVQNVFFIITEIIAGAYLFVIQLLSWFYYAFYWN